jgi:tripartite-type tricarboxylate transporter receptor subunit TctC
MRAMAGIHAVLFTRSGTGGRSQWPGWSAAMLACLPLVAAADDYPSRNITVIVPFAAGGGTDMFARVIGQGITKTTGRNVIIDNRSGGGGTIGTGMAAGAVPDGYTLLYSASSIMNHNTLYPKLSYDVERDFITVSRPVMIPFVLAVHPSLPAANVKQLIALAKARPGQLNYGGTGAGSQGSLSIELMKQHTGTNMVFVPYRGAGPVMNAVVSGEVGFAMLVTPLARPHLDNGKLRALAVTSKNRISLLPQLPTMAESGLPGFEAVQWHGMFAQAKTPDAIVKWLHANIRGTMQQPQTKEFFAREGAEPVDESSQDFARFLRAEIAKWRDIIQRAGIKN